LFADLLAHVGSLLPVVKKTVSSTLIDPKAVFACSLDFHKPFAWQGAVSCLQAAAFGRRSSGGVDVGYFDL
jgi:hypothetical protein